MSYWKTHVKIKKLLLHVHTVNLISCSIIHTYYLIYYNILSPIHNINNPPYTPSLSWTDSIQVYFLKHIRIMFKNSMYVGVVNINSSLCHYNSLKVQKCYQGPMQSAIKSETTNLNLPQLSILCFQFSLWYSDLHAFRWVLECSAGPSGDHWAPGRLHGEGMRWNRTSDRIMAAPLGRDTLPEHWSYGVCGDGRVFFIKWVRY